MCMYNILIFLSSALFIKQFYYNEKKEKLTEQDTRSGWAIVQFHKNNNAACVKETTKLKLNLICIHTHTIEMYVHYNHR